MNLILIFNGWGMDKGILEKQELPKGYEIKVLDYPYNVDIDFSLYDTVIYVGWSFGCHYLARYILTHAIKSDKIVALNGHGEILGKYGINPAMFDLTYNTLTEENLKKFYKNMDVSDDFTFPERDFEEVKEELLQFKKQFEPLENVFKIVFLGKRDRIIPYRKQKRYFKGKDVETVELDTGHYPFEIRNLLKQIAERAGNKHEF